jgi:hypothetical protein
MSELKIPETSRAKHNKKHSPMCGKHPKGAEDFMTKPGGVNWTGPRTQGVGASIASGVASVAAAALQQGQGEEESRQAASKARLEKSKQSILRR